MIWNILTFFALLFAFVDFVLILHTLVCTNRYYHGLSDWAKEIDKCNSSYIKQEFAKLKYENNLIVSQDNE